MISQQTGRKFNIMHIIVILLMAVVTLLGIAVRYSASTARWEQRMEDNQVVHTQQIHNNSLKLDVEEKKLTIENERLSRIEDKLHIPNIIGGD